MLPKDQEKTMGEAVREARLSQGLSQVELAKKMGCIQTQVSRIETGDNHNTATLKRVAEALGAKLVIAIYWPE